MGQQKMGPNRSRAADQFAFLLLGVGLGALVAAVIAILYAPQAGEETRELISERSRELTGRARTGGDQFIRRVREATDEWAAKLQAAADDLVAQGRMTAEEARSQVGEVLSRVQN